MSYTTRSPSPTSARRPSWTKVAVPDIWTPTATSASDDLAISAGVRLNRSASASTVETWRYPRRSVAIRPSNGPSPRGATSIGTSVLLTASFQYATLSRSGTEAVVNTTLNFSPLRGSDSGAATGGNRTLHLPGRRRPGARQGRTARRTGNDLAGVQPDQLGEVRVSARTEQPSSGPFPSPGRTTGRNRQNAALMGKT
ncbi:hypothetical protein GCM10018966_020730 [Streptomyces yanii]